MRKKTTITKAIIKEVEALARKGFNNVLIGQSLSIAPQTLSTNKELKEAIQRGKLKLASTISDSILATLEENPSTQQLLIKRLGLFNPQINIKKPKTSQEALNSLSEAIKQYSNGEINESQLRTLEATLNSFIKAHDIVELENRIKALEDLQNEK